MIRLVVHRSLSAPAALLALTIGAAPLAAFAQRPGDTPAIEALQERILAVQQRDGENSANLIDP
ncbi:MAG TPA: hypothetical protein VFJ95_11015 [Gammaproteobacteria bacterium]|nr:hypothetical protein [Gammaproteobacteria bacterium]